MEQVLISFGPSHHPPTVQPGEHEVAKTEYIPYAPGRWSVITFLIAAVNHCWSMAVSRPKDFYLLLCLCT